MDISYVSTEPARQPVILYGSCSCRYLTYFIIVESTTDLKTCICHCARCKKAFGGAFGLTVKVPVHGFKYTRESGESVIHVGETDKKIPLYREFCGKCGSHICEYHEGIKEHFRHVTVGTLDDSSQLPPKGEFFCSQREAWMPEIPGKPVQFIEM